MELNLRIHFAGLVLISPLRVNLVFHTTSVYHSRSQFLTIFPIYHFSPFALQAHLVSQQYSLTFA